ncbi:uncharacterized protein LOC119399902 [Rhipicephalus sanguineus]|uniref:uncharacterized protein LOC119399902 n=1 Tax=Rhipicephalus sanguineus TaxID=34632 RepID=UPI0020C3D545|nr:uncharacterized protein LOC119399902 [Rhipicephalus sanguineus]
MLAAKFVNDTLTERRGRIISQGARELYEFERFPKESYRKNDDEIVWYAIKLTERGPNVVLLSDDINVRTKALINHVETYSATDYENMLGYCGLGTPKHPAKLPSAPETL